MNPTEKITKQTIDDFGEQWKNYRDNPGLYGSAAFLSDLFGPLLPVENIKDTSVLEIGSGTGRIVNMLLDSEVSNVFALEPAHDAFKVLKENTKTRASKITYLEMPGSSIPPNLNLDYVFSIGVIHHIPDPTPTIKAAWQALRPGGKILIWIYGIEGNATYLALALPLRKITKHIPHPLLKALCSFLLIFLDLYIFLCKFLPLPMHVYMQNVLAKFPRSVRHMTIYDQLNPAYAKYYTEAEGVVLLQNANFKDIKTYHRHGYSWTIIGTKPE